MLFNRLDKNFKKWLEFAAVVQDKCGYFVVDCDVDGIGEQRLTIMCAKTKSSSCQAFSDEVLIRRLDVHFSETKN